jgi:hypothetical protein
VSGFNGELEARPIKAVSLKILAQAVGIIGRGSARAGGAEEYPARFGKRATAPANPNHFSKLHPVEGIDRVYLLWSDQLFQRIRDTRPA